MKEIILTAETEEALHRYIRTDRSRLDPLGRTKLAQLGTTTRSSSHEEGDRSRQERFAGSG